MLGEIGSEENIPAFLCTHSHIFIYLDLYLYLYLYGLTRFFDSSLCIQAVLRMLGEIGSEENIPAFVCTHTYIYIYLDLYLNLYLHLYGLTRFFPLCLGCAAHVG